jgi:hypothetical protein
MRQPESYTTQELADRWIGILREKTAYKHHARANSESTTSPSIDDICNEMIAYFTGIIN